MDRADARPDWVINETFDLFAELGASDIQLEFPVVYATALDGKASLDWDAAPGETLVPLFQTIVDHVAPPKVTGTNEDDLQAMISTIDVDAHLGRLGIGKVFSGELKPNHMVTVFRRDGTKYSGRVQNVYVYEGLKRTLVDAAVPGDIIAVTGIPDITIGETIAFGDNPTQLPPPTVDEPTLQMTFSVNTSPFAGKEGLHHTSRKLRERLMKELESNVALRVEETESSDAFRVFGRGELHLAVLIETMRREGYELQVSMAEVIYRDSPKGRTEPFERVLISVQDEYVGAVVQTLGERKGELQDMRPNDKGGTRLEFVIPTRGLLGFRGMFMTLTRGTGVMSTILEGYKPFAGEMDKIRRGSLIASDSGQTTTFGLANAEERGILFIPSQMQVYAGMIVGKHQREGDLVVNVCKVKQLTNMRSSTSDVGIRLTTPTTMSLDRSLEYIGPDDLVEVTPKSVRMRKKELDAGMRRRSEKRGD
jgi:GTP-binding protein